MEDSVKVEEVNSTEYKVLIQVAPENVDKKFDEFFESIKNLTLFGKSKEVTSSGPAGVSTKPLQVFNDLGIDYVG
ncbi:hypothetical protein LCGC14_1320440 [marine sediment metagenome]|uniref:Uncharacterized protein n=1 Tax=marine sediment metagenome TaxID=412755 RepID=A0A0F9KK81_9ZZZZ